MSIQDIRQKPVIIELGGQEMELNYNLNAFAELEEVYGTINDAMKAMGEGSIKALRALLWAGLIDTQEISIKEVGKLVNMANLKEVVEAVTKAISQATPKDEPKNVQNPVK